MDKEQDIIEILKQYKQEHIINLLNILEEKQKEETEDKTQVDQK